MKTRATLLLTALIGTLVVLGAPPAGADAACSIVEQVTNTTGAGANAVQLPAIDADGSRIAFVSSRDLTGDNADLNGEIFLADLNGDTMTQVTDSLGGGNPNFLPEISDDGTKVVFESSADLTGDNADNSDEVFLFNSTGSTITQLTDDPAGDFFNGAPDISGDGTDVAFISDDDLTGGNSGNHDQVFLVNTSGPRSYTQLTATPAGQGTDDPSVNQTGSRIAYSSTANPTGGNADNNREVFVVDPSGPTTVQLTTTGASINNGEPELSEDGTRVTFTSNANLTGGNADANQELFRRTINTAGFVQITNTTAGFIQAASTDQTGARAVFRSGAPAPRNADGSSEIDIADVGLGRPSAVTANPAGIDSPGSDISDDGLVVALTSEANPLGTNADGNFELFLARCGARAAHFTDVPAANSSFGPVQWMADLGITPVPGNHLFHPATNATRRQTAVFLYNLAGRPAFTPPSTATFVDVPLGSSGRKQIEWMASEGITPVPSNHRFQPAGALTRRQMASFLFNLAGQPLFAVPGTATFTDVPVGNAFRLPVEWLAVEGIVAVPGNHLFHPTDPVKRGQLANFLHNFAVSPGVDLTN